MFYFLYKNKQGVRVDNQELYNFAKRGAESHAKLKEETVAAIRKFLDTYMEALEL